MRVIAAFFGPYAPDALTAHVSVFSHDFKRFERFTKLATSSKAHDMQPVISPNRRNAKTPIAIARMFRWFDRRLYRLRYKVERTFGWQDTFRKLVISYDRLPEIRKGCRLLAYSMINFRTTFNTS